MPKNWLLILLFSLISLSGRAQVFDNFADSNFTANPVWSGDSSKFLIDSLKELQSNGSNVATDTVYLVTPNTMMDSVEWDILMRLEFNPSTTNYARIYLVSDQPNLKGPLNGYFIQFGEAGANPDSLDFFKQTGSTITQLFSGSLPCGVSASICPVRIKVKRDFSGNWQILADCSGGYNFVQHGVINDMSFTSTSWFGVYGKYQTTSRYNKYFWDDVYIGPYIGDTIRPTLVSTTAMSATTVEVVFSEPVSLATAQNSANYSASGGLLNPSSAVRNPSDSTKVMLTFGTVFGNGVNYTLTVSNIADTAGNVMLNPMNGNFMWFVSGNAVYKDVLINEIFADPDSNVTNLPGFEYLELFNRSSQIFDLAGWKISDISPGVTLPSYVFAPGSYVILCKAADTSRFSPFGPVIPVSLPTLNNSGDFLGLRNNAGTLIDTVPYTDSWYQDMVKMTGGWSLELIDPNDTCRLDSNWIASEDPDGGTPGQVNSVLGTNPDNTAPSIASINVFLPDSIQVCFNERMSGTMIVNAANYSVSPTLGTPSQAITQGTLFTCVTLVFSQPIDSGIVYTLSVSNGTDCAGNIAGTLTGNFAIGGNPLPGQMVITEIFPDPSPRIGIPELEFVEIKNNGASAVTLSGWKIWDRTGTPATIPTKTILPNEYLILTSTTADDSFFVFGNVAGITSFPSLNNSDDSLELLDPSGAVADYLYYSDSWYQDDVKKDGGWTLERTDADFHCVNPLNWKASADPTGGTPGRVNSNAGVFIDAILPYVLNATVLSPTQILVRFSEPIDAIAISDPAHYLIDQGIGQPLTAIPANAALTSVLLTLANPIDSNKIYTVVVNGISDCPGNALGTPDEASFGIPLPAAAGDILINEILFNPATGGSDFVELYNHSDKIIDLLSLKLGEGFPGTDSAFNEEALASESFLFFPGVHLAFTPDKNFQLISYLPPFSDNILELPAFPGYDDSEGDCILKNASGETIDRFAYLDDFHFADLDDKEGVSLERLSWNRPTQDAGNWHSAATTVRYATPGYQNSQSLDEGGPSGEIWLDPSTFSPDNDGWQDVLSIRYHFSEPGNNLKITALDNQGRFVKTISRNLLAGTEEAAVTWDGINADGSKADVGVYVILAETSNPNTGKTKRFKLACVLAAKL